jgi:nucleoside-diphosphate-sugar epimerase
MGRQLAHELQQQGYSVRISVRTEAHLAELAAAPQGFHPCLINITPDAVIGDTGFFDADVVAVVLPPEKSSDGGYSYPHIVGQLCGVLPPAVRLLFVSSTSVYPDNGARVMEEDAPIPESPVGWALLEAERLLRQRCPMTTVVRFGGLLGGGRAIRLTRHPSDSRPVNLIHQRDAVGILLEIIRRGFWGETVNACCPHHPPRDVFYREAALVRGLQPPVNEVSVNGKWKIVDSRQLQRLHYRFKYANPLDCLYPES